MPKKLTLFLDMDGVLSDFETNFSKFLNCKKEDLNHKLIYANFSKYIAYDGFLKQEKLDRSNELVKWLLTFQKANDINLSILTSCGMSPASAVSNQKMKWLEYHFPELNNVPFCTVTSGGAKSSFAGPKKFLLDDHHKNVEKFIAAGGEGHIYSPKNLHSVMVDLHDFYKKWN